MPRILEYSKILKKLDKKIHLPIKNVDTIKLDIDKKYNLKEEDYGKNLNTIIIGKNLVDEIFTDIRIYNTKVNNIYVEGYPNLGGVTIPYNIIKNDIDISISFSKDSKINKLNILNDKNIVLELGSDVENICINKSNEGNMNIGVHNKKERIYYEIDELGNKKIEKNNYYIDEKDINNGVLDLTKLTEYNNWSFTKMRVDTLIINKYYLKNIDKLKKLNPGAYIPFHDKVTFNNLRIVDDNDMKLNPLDKTFDVTNGSVYFSTRFNKNFIYIKNNDDNNIIIFIDKNNNIKVIERNELLSDDNVDYAIIKYNEENIGYSLLKKQNLINLILIKYNDYYKVIDFNNEYILDNIFFKIISYNVNKYFSDKEVINALNNNDFITVFNSEEFSYNLFHEMYTSYLNHIKYIECLKELGFNNETIKYLFDKKFNNIINPYNNIIEDITENEIEHFNNMAKEYTLKKVKTYEIQ